MLGLSRELLIKGQSDEHVYAYYEYMVELAVIYGAEWSRAKREMLQSLEFEIALANVSQFISFTSFHLFVDMTAFVADRQISACRNRVSSDKCKRSATEISIHQLDGLYQCHATSRPKSYGK